MGADLRPIAAHGYSAHVLALMHPVPRLADNAAAAAYRSGEMQVVQARPGALGAIVAPLISADGCVGALTAEVKNGGEESAHVQALATIVAAQLSGALTPAASQTVPRQKSASA